MSGPRAAAVLSVAIILLGVLVVVRTLSLGTGGGLGLVLGGLMIVAGALRLWMVKPWRRG
ncbi:MAG: hypothetical protein AB7V62_02705 [Thermoleophilia bacterium]